MAQSPKVEEYQAKAGFVLNFIKFTRFPRPLASISVCVAGESSVIDSFSGLEKEKAKGLAIRVLSVDGSRIDPDCDVLFVAKTEGTRERSLIQSCASFSVLTVGESPNFTGSGGIIRLFQRDANIRFEVNLEAMRAASLDIDSSVLSLAKTVD